MPSQFYSKALKRLLDAEIDFLGDDIRALLVDTDEYSADFDVDEFLADVLEDGRIGSPVSLTGKSTTNGVFDADDATFEAVSGDSVETVLLFKNTGDESTSPLIAMIELPDPVTPSSGAIAIQWSDGAAKIFKIG